MPSIVEERRLAAGALTLAARHWRPAQGRPLLALHGWLDNANSFARLAPELPEASLCALDLAGHGLSDHRQPGGTYHLLDNVTDVLAAADALGWHTFDLLGHSLGGGIATYVAAVAPERVRRLILIEGLGTMSSPAKDAPAILRRSIADQRDLASKNMPVYADIEAASAARSHGFGGLGLPAARCLCERGLMPDPGGVTWRSDPRLRTTSMQRLGEDQVLALIRAIQAPVLYIEGDRGMSRLAPQYPARLAAVSRLTRVLLPGGHHLHLDESPQAVAAAIREFLAAPAAP